jgi:hypothetical protein
MVLGMACCAGAVLGSWGQGCFRWLMKVNGWPASCFVGIGISSAEVGLCSSPAAGPFRKLLGGAGMNELRHRECTMTWGVLWQAAMKPWLNTLGLHVARLKPCAGGIRQ